MKTKIFYDLKYTREKITYDFPKTWQNFWNCNAHSANISSKKCLENYVNLWIFTINKIDKIWSRYLRTTILCLLITSATLFAVVKDQILPEIKENIITSTANSLGFYIIIF